MHPEIEAAIATLVRHGARVELRHYEQSMGWRQRCEHYPYCDGCQHGCIRSLVVEVEQIRKKEVAESGNE